MNIARQLKITGATATKPKRILMDKLTVGDIITIRMHKNASTVMFQQNHPGFEDEQVVFMGITGEGENRHAEFIGADGHGGLMRWGCYRYQGRWAYGSSAERLSVIDVKPFTGLQGK